MHKLKSAQARVALPLLASTLLSIISYSSQEASLIHTHLVFQRKQAFS